MIMGWIHLLRSLHSSIREWRSSIRTMWTLFWIVSGLWNFSRGEWRACGEGHRQIGTGDGLLRADKFEYHIAIDISRICARRQLGVCQIYPANTSRFAVTIRGHPLSRSTCATTPETVGCPTRKLSVIDDEKHKADQPA